MRKPLIIFTPKSLLRHPKAVSTIQELETGGFREVLDDPGPLDPQRISRVLLCSGKIYYDLLAAREERKADHIAIVRLEQLYPFLQSSVNDILLRYPLTAEVIWAQEEPRNMGAWRFLREQIQPLLDSSGRELRYIGRSESASPATGSLKRHQQEQAEIMDEALTADEGWVAGGRSGMAGGVILHTKDAGDTWEVQLGDRSRATAPTATCVLWDPRPVLRSRARAWRPPVAADYGWTELGAGREPSGNTGPTTNSHPPTSGSTPPAPISTARGMAAGSGSASISAGSRPKSTA